MAASESEPACLAGWDTSSTATGSSNSSKYSYMGRARPLPRPCMSQRHPRREKGG